MQRKLYGCHFCFVGFVLQVVATAECESAVFYIEFRVRPYALPLEVQISSQCHGSRQGYASTSQLSNNLLNGSQALCFQVVVHKTLSFLLIRQVVSMA